MYQSNQLISEAFFAAVRSLEKIPIFWKLTEMRKQNFFNGTLSKTRFKKCTCNGDYDKVLTFPYFFPLFPSEGHSYLGEYSVLPFFYLIALNGSRALPLVELLEIPLMYKEVCAYKLEKEKIDLALSGIGESHIVSHKKITKENLDQEISEIRKKVIQRTFDMTNSAATLFFSTFSNLPECILSSDQSGYVAASSIVSKNISWTFQSDKIIPIKLKNNLFSFTLSSWALSKHEV